MKRILAFALIFAILFLTACGNPEEEPATEAESGAYSVYSAAKAELLGYGENCYCEAILVLHSLTSGEQVYRITTERLGNDAASTIERETETVGSDMKFVYKDGILYSDFSLGETESKTAVVFDREAFFSQYAISPAGLLPDLAEGDFTGASLTPAEESTSEESEAFGADARILSLTLKPAQVKGILAAVELDEKTENMSNVSCKMVFDAASHLTLILVQGSIAAASASDIFSVTVGFDTLGSVREISLPADAENYR